MREELLRVRFKIFLNSKDSDEEALENLGLALSDLTCHFFTKSSSNFRKNFFDCFLWRVLYNLCEGHCCYHLLLLILTLDICMQVFEDDFELVNALFLLCNVSKCVVVQ